MKDRRSVFRVALTSIVSAALAPFVGTSRAQATREAIVWPIEIPIFHNNFLQLLGLLATRHLLNGKVPARAFTALFPFSPTVPGTIERINARNDIVFASGAISNDGTPGIYQFDDDLVGRVSFRLPSRLSGVCTGDLKELTIDFGPERPRITFAKLPPILAGMPKVYDVHALLLNEERARITLVDHTKKHTLVLELVHLGGAKLFVNSASSGLRTLGMMAALKFIAPSVEVPCFGCKGDDCKPGDLPLEPDYCVGYYRNDQKKMCFVITDEDMTKWNKLCSENPNLEVCKKGPFVPYSCTYDSESEAINAKNGDARCK